MRLHLDPGTRFFLLDAPLPSAACAHVIEVITHTCQRLRVELQEPAPPLQPGCELRLRNLRIHASGLGPQLQLELLASSVERLHLSLSD